MSEWIRKEIHKQSHIPDFIDAGSGDNLSGVAIDKLLYDFEFVAATKEALFRQGLAKRFDLINTILRKSRGVTIDKRDVNIVMQRNVPSNDLENAKVFQAYAGMISNRTLIENYATFTDWQTEEERLEAEETIDVEAGRAAVAEST
jgi:SPP1 family phage portal protein